MDHTAKITAITSDVVQERFTDAFRRHVGLGKPFSRADIAAQTGMDVTTISGLMDGKGPPALWRLLRIAAVLGPAFTNELLDLAGQGGVDRLDAADVGILHVNKVAAALAAQVADDLSDGVITPAEEADEAALVQKLHEISGDYLARRQRHGVRIKKVDRLRAVGG